MELPNELVTQTVVWDDTELFLVTRNLVSPLFFYDLNSFRNQGVGGDELSFVLDTAVEIRTSTLIETLLKQSSRPLGFHDLPRVSHAILLHREPRMVFSAFS